MKEILLSSWFIIFLITIFVSIILITLIYFIIRHFIRLSLLKKHHDLAGFIINIFGVLYSVFLGFTIVSSQQNINDLDSKINEEAYLLDALYQSVTILPHDISFQMRDKIMAYLNSIVKDEWSLMAYQKENPVTLMKLEDMLKDFYNFKPQTEQERLWFSKSLDILLKMGSARLNRIYSSWNSLGILSWMVLLIGGIILVTLLLFFGSENFRVQILLNSLFISFFIFIIFVIYALNNPFKKPIALKPKAYEVIYNYNIYTHGSLKSPEELLKKR